MTARPDLRAGAQRDHQGSKTPASQPSLCPGQEGPGRWLHILPRPVPSLTRACSGLSRLLGLQSCFLPLYRVLLGPGKEAQRVPGGKKGPVSRDTASQGGTSSPSSPPRAREPAGTWRGLALSVKGLRTWGRQDTGDPRGLTQDTEGPRITSPKSSCRITDPIQLPPKLQQPSTSTQGLPGLGIVFPAHSLAALPTTSPEICSALSQTLQAGTLLSRQTPHQLSPHPTQQTA